jgi:4-hydroxy-tetrahydrodipicolinate reductase
MNIALIGYGKMGRLVRLLAEEKGHVVNVVVNEAHGGLPAEQLSETLRTAEVAIDFSSAEAVRRNVEACLAAGIPIVEGTTGWNEHREEIERLVGESGGTMVFGANFSIGVNLFYKIAERAAELFAKFPEYEVFIEEQHHSRKKDAPSGTALKIKEIIEHHVEVPSVAATRTGNIPGTHRVGFDGKGDQILLEHTARSREGFAAGAIMAAEWVVEKKGFFEFTDVIDEMIGATG